MILCSYEKAASDVLKQLEKDSNIFVIKSFSLKTTLAIIYDYSSLRDEFNCLEIVDILKIIPSLLSRIKETLPFPKLQNSLRSTQLTQDFIIELISQYGLSWIPTESFLFKEAIESSLPEVSNLKYWQRYIRTISTQQHEELVFLLTDSDERVRTKASYRLRSEKLF